MAETKINSQSLEARYQGYSDDAFSGLDANINGTLDAHLPAEANTFAKHIFGAVTPPTTIFAGEDPHIQFGIKIRDGKIKLPGRAKGSIAQVRDLNMSVKGSPNLKSSILNFYITDERDNLGFKITLGPFTLFQPIIHTNEIQALSPDGVHYIPEELPLSSAISGLLHFLKNPPKEKDFESRADLPFTLHRVLSDLNLTVKARLTAPIFKLMGNEALALGRDTSSQYGYFATETVFENPLATLDKKAENIQGKPDFTVEKMEESITSGYPKTVISINGYDTPLQLDTQHLFHQLGKSKSDVLAWLSEHAYTLQDGDIYAPANMTITTPDGRILNVVDLRFIKKDKAEDSLKAPLILKNKTLIRANLEGLRSSSGEWALTPLDIKLAIATRARADVTSLAGALTLDEMGPFAPFSHLDAGITLSYGMTVRSEELNIPNGFSIFGITIPELSALFTKESPLSFDNFKIKYNPDNGLQFDGSFKGEIHAKDIILVKEKIVESIDASIECAGGKEKDILLSCSAQGEVRLPGQDAITGSFGIDISKGPDSSIKARIHDVAVKKDTFNFDDVEIREPSVKIKQIDIQTIPEEK